MTDAKDVEGRKQVNRVVIIGGLAYLTAFVVGGFICWLIQMSKDIGTCGSW